MNEDLKLSPRGEELIKGFEKCELEAYKGGVADPWTIGWGATYYEDGSAVKKGDKITQERADELFTFHAPKYEKVVRAKIKRPLLQNEFDALVSFAYNAGAGYKSNGKYYDFNLWKNVNVRMTGEEMFKYWTTLAITQGGVKKRGLIRRRKSEVTMFLYSQLNFFE